jgi:hypothetical protein
MRLKVRIRLPRFPVFLHQRATLAGATGGPSFHAILADCEEDWVVQHRSPPVTAARPNVIRPTRTGPSPLRRAWSWLHAKYSLTATKRLRVAETISLGEKRFVALISLEGREFLIGGGASGVSLLAQLDTTPDPARGLRSVLDGEGDAT